MGFQGSIKKILLENPDPGKIKKAAALTSFAAIFAPKNNFYSKSEKKLAILGFNHVRKFFKNDGKAVFTSLFSPIELVYAFGLVPFSLEILAGAASYFGIATELLNRTEKEWITTDFCSFHRCYMGIAYIGLFPVPKFLLATSHTCDGTFKSFSEVGHYLSRPLFLIDTPYTLSEESIRYVSHQIKEIVEKIELLTGNKLKMKNLEKVFYYSNRARDALAEINRLRKSRKPLMPGEEGFGFIVNWGNMLGTRSGARVFESYRDEIKKRKQSKYNNIKGKKRILWLHLKPYFSNDLIRYIESELDITIVMEEMNYVFFDRLDINKPWKSLSLKLLENYWVGGIERRLKLIIEMIEDYNIDGVIHFSHWGCRQSCGAVKLIKDTVQEKGVPFLNIDGDCIDGRNYSFGQYKTRLEGFMEIIG